MDDYPDDYVGRNLSFILLSGLEDGLSCGSAQQDAEYPFLQTKGTRIESDFPRLSGPIAEQLRRAFVEEDASQASWNSKLVATGKVSVAEWKMKSSGRSYKLPPRKADPPPVSPPRSPVDEGDLGNESPVILHSPISPLTPNSPIFPDGMLTPLWVRKHQALVPAAVINFFPFSLDANMSSLCDNQIKIEVNGLKSQWSTTGFKTRIVVVLVSEESEDYYIGHVDDRIASIRRATNMDQKSLFVLPPNASLIEITEFVRSLLKTLQPSVVEYYRDLSKHARRKRNRSTIPPPTAPPTSGTSQTLSMHGWNVRYEFKLGVFAEFRQEMDAACRNYESAYETLFGEEVFGNIAGWSPRFNDARLLADILAIRIIRCLLWTGQPTAAVRTWIGHRDRCSDIVNRRGKGTRNYGWEAWEARWSMVMAQLIHRADLSSFSGASPAQGTALPIIFTLAEKTSASGDRINPWEQLHHPGYWLYRAAKHSMLRRTLAEQIPEEDRRPPGETPASHIANKSYLYDTYLVPETHEEAPLEGRTGFDHSKLIIHTLKEALEEFAKRQQTKKAESISLELVEEYMRVGSWSEAYDVLQTLWPTLSWRRSGWWELMAKFGWALRECALRLCDAETVIRVDWELGNNVFPAPNGWKFDLHKSLDRLPVEKPKPSIVFRAEDVVGCLNASLVFHTYDGNVGEPVHSQLVISSYAHPHSGVIALSEIKIVFEGCFRPVRIQASEDHKSDETAACSIVSVPLRESSSTDPSSLQSPTSSLAPLVGYADLTIGPSQTRVLNFAFIPREAGEARVASITILIEDEKYDLACAITEQAHVASFWWQQSANGLVPRRIGKDRDITKCKILPKPPKIRITAPDLMKTYYTNERVVLNIVFHNAEDEPADVSAEIRFLGPPDSATKMQWLEEQPGAEEGGVDASSAVDGASRLLKKGIGVMACAMEKSLAIALTDTSILSTFSLEISAVYHLISDVQTPVVKTMTVDLSFVRPFEANYEFLPRLHPQPWPDFFHVRDDLVTHNTEQIPSGLQQRWCLNCKVVSFALEPIIIKKSSLVLLGLGGGAVCDIGTETVIKPGATEILPEEFRESNFTIDVQKADLGDRRPTSLNLALEIQWRRKAPSRDLDNNDDDATSIITSVLPIPRFLVPSGEPRVLASVTPSPAVPGFMHLDYTLENPSLHLLTFNLTMEASEQFAFSGPKTTVVQLVPLSRHTIRYNLLATKRRQWIQPQLVVMDTYFNKTLRVLPTENMRSDKRGILIWVDADE